MKMPSFLKTQMQAEITSELWRNRGNYGGVLSGLWVSQIAVNDRYIEFGFYMLAIGSAFLVLLPLLAKAIFARYEQSQ